MINLAQEGLRQQVKKALGDAAPYTKRLGAAAAAALLASTPVLGGIAPFGPALTAAAPAAALPFVAAGAVLGCVLGLPFAASGGLVAACVVALCLRFAMQRFAPDKPGVLISACGSALTLLVAEMLSQLRLGASIEKTFAAFAEAALLTGFALLGSVVLVAAKRGLPGLTGNARFAVLAWGMAVVAALCRVSLLWVSLGVVVSGALVCCLAFAEDAKTLYVAVAAGVGIIAYDTRLAPFAIGMGLGALLAMALHGARSRMAVGYCAGACFGMLLCHGSAMLLACFANGLLSAVLFLLLPDKLVTLVAGVEEGEKGRLAAASTRVRQLGNALCDVADTVREVCRTIPQKTEIGELPDYLTDSLCRNCKNNCNCWVANANTMMDGMNALQSWVAAGSAVTPQTLPEQVSTCCIKPYDLCRALNEYSSERLALRCAATKSDALRTAVTSQLSVMSQALATVAKELASPAPLRAKYRIETASAGAAAEGVSADVVRSFSGMRSQAHLLLCDGMGVGRAAAVDGTLAASLARQLLEAGFDAVSTVRLINIALSLPEGEAGATIDILTVDLARGICRVYKAGGAPTYFVRNGRVGSLSSETLPVGILDEVRGSETKLDLGAGDVAVMVSDGMLAAGDIWIQMELQRVWESTPQNIADTLLDGAKKRRGARADDMTVAVMRIVPITEDPMM
ncbi:PP2C family protein-serine/threonine phosphatase [Pygmaiobacter massiliensis]|uniref:PP2C family protein-serine/threonine phosphatase n=1 Tax=Pygmaiobacter massiliensis TaxID=1917873 RepID=UPI002A8271DC|nr:PP2C family protein-serine/threonine phosphatase [Pygmaiobacter massiliensis]MDY4785063.1 PP2C family protein-serine/threonine phosphatase [Pygmaiobacter massiliensis]